MKKNKALKWVGIALLALIIIGAAGALAFYFSELKPRIDVVVSIARAFESFDDNDVLELDLSDGQQILLDISTEPYLSGIVYDEGETYDGLEFGYMDKGIWLNIPEVSSKYYLLDWTDDVSDLMDESAAVSLLRLSDEQKEELANSLFLLRDELLNEDEFDFTPTLINRILGLDCLKADILELYRQIDFSDEGKESITVDGESFVCRKYTASVTQEYVKILLNTDGAGAFLEGLGDVLGDIYMDIYIYEGNLKYISIETSFLYMPSIDMGNLLAGDLSADSVGFTAAPLNGEVAFRADGSMEISAELTSNFISLEASILMSVYDTEITWGYVDEEELNIFEAGYLRLILEAAKWEDALNSDEVR